jgi:hypothetical protein
MRFMARVGVLVAVVVIGVAGFTAGVVGAIRTREHYPPATKLGYVPSLIKVQFKYSGRHVVNGASFQGTSSQSSGSCAYVVPDHWVVHPKSEFTARINGKNRACQVSFAFYRTPSNHAGEFASLHVNFGDNFIHPSVARVSKDFSVTTYPTHQDHVVVVIHDA